MENPLVSIIVITYNSSKYVIETLESAKNQSYQNIELIVSDDCSTDNTVGICNNWIEKNKERFFHTKLITVEQNSGIAPNCNRGLYVANGEWVKFIAGDDILLKNCIELFSNYCVLNPNSKIIFGRIYYMNNKVLKEEDIKSFYSLTQKEQYIKVIKGSGIPSQASFINKNLLNDLNGFDENYKYIEDAPLWIKASEKGIYFNFIDELVVKYRLHDNNISGMNKSNNYINIKFYTDQKKILQNEIIPRLKHMRKYNTIAYFYNYLIITDFIIKLGNKNNNYSKIIKLLVIKSTIKSCINLFKKTLKKYYLKIIND